MYTNTTSSSLPLYVPEKKNVYLFLLVSQARQLSSLEYSSVGHFPHVHPSLLLHSMRTNMTVIFLQLYCHHWNKSCNCLISNTPALNKALQPISFSVVHHKIQSQLKSNFSLDWILHQNSWAQTPSVWVPQTKKHRRVGEKCIGYPPL